MYPKLPSIFAMQHRNARAQVEPTPPVSPTWVAGRRGPVRRSRPRGVRKLLGAMANAGRGSQATSPCSTATAPRLATYMSGKGPRLGQQTPDVTLRHVRLRNMVTRICSITSRDHPNAGRERVARPAVDGAFSSRCLTFGNSAGIRTGLAMLRLGHRMPRLVDLRRRQSVWRTQSNTTALRSSICRQPQLTLGPSRWSRSSIVAELAADTGSRKFEDGIVMPDLLADTPGALRYELDS